ncbi:methyl-accepting chemotaxis protein [Halomonas sp. HMF6819]|uniref:methyl-accepting chemotaxis protein n=1 Tax=Halomonas sp. HMF6819 TaxID=3373085 RepID=UPI0037A3EBAE
MSAQRQLKISTRLTIAFSILLFFLAALTAIGIYQVGQINRDLAEINDVNAVKQRHAIDWRGSVHDRAIALRDLVITATENQYRDLSSEIQRLQDNYLNASQEMAEITREYPGPAEEARIIESVQAQQALALELTEAVVGARLAGDFAQAQTLLIERAGPAYAEWLSLINQFIDLQERLNNVTTDHARNAASSFQNLMLGLTLLALIIGGLMAFWLSRQLLGELGAEPFEVQTFSNAIGNGNLAVANERHNKRERGIMASQVAMAKQLEEIVLKVRGCAEAVASNSEQIAEGNTNLASRTEQQSSALAQTAAAMEQLNSTVTQNADNAERASLEATQATATAAQGGKAVREMTTTMNELDQSSQEISGIISTIDAIAFQTNILALNASVEAARAGEHGRGFAVVAGEVRNLAQRSASAAKEINELISKNLERVKHGNERASLARQSTEEIIGAIERVNVIMNEISSASAEQSAGVREINQAVSEMDQMTQDNANLVSESASASNTLRHNARELINAMQTFKLPASTSASTPTAPVSSARALAATRNTASKPLVQSPTEPAWESF